MRQQALALESMNGVWRKFNEAETKRQAETGIQTIKFDSSFREKAYEVAWAAATKQSLEHAPQMRSFSARTLYPGARVARRLRGGAARRLALAITIDVIGRNLGMGTLPWILEVSEYVLPLATFFVAPWLLYRNEHVRLDILVQTRPWLGHVANIVGLAVCAVLVVYGVRTTTNSASRAR